jgi:hypothetical protein
MSVHWNDYEPYQPPHSHGPWPELTRKQAREVFEHMMSAKAERIAQLRELLQKNGVLLGEDDESIQTLNEWFCDNVQPHPDIPGRPQNIWFAVATDIALFLGDVVIGRWPHLHWELFIWGKKNADYHAPVVMGFRNAANPRFHYNLFRNISGLAHRIAGGWRDEEDRSYFLKRVNYVSELEGDPVDT